MAGTGTITLLSVVTGLKPRTISYIHSGDYQVQEYCTELKFIDQGTPVWTTSSTNIPGPLMLKQGESMEGRLRKTSEKPNISFFDGILLPKFLQKPSTGQGNIARQTLGGSQFTTKGLK